MAGTITKKTENTWLVRIFLGRDANGRTKHFNKTIHGSKKDAQKFLTARLRERDLGVFIEPSADSLNTFLDRWLREIAKNKLRKRTFETYESLIKSHVRDSIGLKKISDLTASDVQRLYSSMKTKGYSSKTVRHVHNILSPAFKQAVRWRMIFQNPCEYCELPRLEKKEMLCLTADQVKLFLEAARTDRYYAAFVLAIETGMRPEEYLGLQWKDIDFEQRALTVVRALIRTKGGGFYFEEPKTKQSRRNIPVSEMAIAALREHRRNQREEIMANRDIYQDGDLVFASRVGTALEHQNFERRHFRRIRDSATIPAIRLYDLRHTTATLLLSAGENPKVVAERLGHASIVLTLDTYSHVLPTMQKNATAKIERLMFGT